MNHTMKLKREEIEEVKKYLDLHIYGGLGNYMLSSAKVGEVVMKLYTSGSLTFSGPDAEVKTQLNKIKNLTGRVDESTIGADEVGTGDSFGSMIFCSAYVPKDIIPKLEDLNVKDSKDISDGDIVSMYEDIKDLVIYSVSIITPSMYADQVQAGRNLNEIKAVAHNIALKGLIDSLNPETELYDKIIMDQFCPPTKYDEYLRNNLNKEDIVKGLTHETKADSKYISVAAAAIIARKHFLDEMDRLSELAGVELLKGTNDGVNEQIQNILDNKGVEVIREIAKTPFKNVVKILSENNHL